ncbi:hypothetical protein [Streptomyces sp. NPDC127112]|uniref:hypothetical protein n=1 Tax=Streptomyces sp. NPDC127112 TaxID=3345364 RepID=UPI0036370722
MPDETVPAPAAPNSAEPRASSRTVGAFGCGGAALVCVLVLVGMLAWGAWASTDFPRVAPEEMANRAVQRSQEAYTVLGFTRTISPGVEKIGVSTENILDSEFCYDGGLLGLNDETIDGAYSMSHSWALDHVPASQAVPGLRRLHRHLVSRGWDVTSYSEGEPGGSWEMFVQRDDGSERMSFTWYPDREYFTGSASGPCAYDPEWKHGDTSPAGNHPWPPAFGPSHGN